MVDIARDKQPHRVKPRRKAKLIPAEVVFAEWRKDPAFMEAYDALEEEFSILRELMRARAAAGLTQAEIAERMGTTQSAVARLEGNGHRASLKSLRGYAEATGHRLRITLEPLAAKTGGARRRAR